ncbi:MAG TPA: toll/interleukin-1 receptor domain-containing protein [Lachnospiraceae bacterium]|nr:toll/interleukin-1 receptor domain-containing protein [uncultured Lachnoclostridium sp.]HAU87164.1 toll/interleukin-1 receptor domain-containing protein [Lachnospiraceae bacterium]
MGGTARQFNKMYMDYKKKFKKPIQQVATLMPAEFTDEYFVDTFACLYPNLWSDLEKQYQYWHKRNSTLIKYGKKSRYDFRKPFNFILDCSFHCRKKLRSGERDNILSEEERKEIEDKIIMKSEAKLKKQEEKIQKALYYVQEIEPKYASKFVDKYFKTHDLHEKLEIIRELSKYKSENIIEFFYKVNACTRNFSLKQESMRYIQGMQLPFVLRRKKKGKKNFIDNEKVKNESSPEILMKRLYVDELEKLKEFDVFISHNSLDEDKIITFYKALNRNGYVAYIDWVNDKFDLKRQWCNVSTVQVIKERIKQSNVFIIFLSETTLKSQWCPWELGYADALGKKICVFQYGLDNENVPHFYKSYPRVYMDETLWVDDGERVEFEVWMKLRRNKQYGKENETHGNDTRCHK